jgi:hypothetical protein
MAQVYVNIVEKYETFKKFNRGEYVDYFEVATLNNMLYARISFIGRMRLDADIAATSLNEVWENVDQVFRGEQQSYRIPNVNSNSGHNITIEIFFI